MVVRSESARRQTAPLSEASVWRPPAVESIEESGLSVGFLADMALKIIYYRGQMTGYDVAEVIRLPFQSVMRPIMDLLKREQLVEVKGSGGIGAGNYQYTITSKGAGRAREMLERTTYTGIAPVRWDDYVQAMRLQGRREFRVNEDMMRQALTELVLEDDVFSKVGPAVNSGRSIFLYGPPGNGKTTIAECIGRLIMTTDMYIPFAVDVDGQIIKIFDDINHIPAPDGDYESPASSARSRTDARWIRIKRPVIMVGGELTLDGLELSYDQTNKYYEAPFQMKANGGMFLIDDFGRQQIRPRDLLNRWVVPMEKYVDFLALHTGRKIEVPFEVLIVFSTNLPPRDLVDEAFLRRIRHKIEITSPSYDSYRDIFNQVCQTYGLEFQEQAVRYLLQEYYVKKNRTPRASHPRDIVEQLIDIANYLGGEPRLSRELLDRAAASYFVDL